MRRELTSDTPLVKARSLTKKFGQQIAVDDISFDIHPGEIIGFLGPNGAGKTTSIRMLLNILIPTSGDLTLFGLNYQAHRNQILQRMNSSSGTISLPGKLSPREILNIFADLYGIQNAQARIDNLIQKFDLGTLTNKPLYALSTGQQVRVSMAKSFINAPDILLLDEPTASLDPDVADRVRSALVNIVQEEGTTVFLTSHNMKEVEQVCTRVLFINGGKIQAEGTPHELAKKSARFKIFIRAKKKLSGPLNIHSIGDIELSIHEHELKAALDKNQIGPFLTELIKQGIEFEDLKIDEPTLEDFFLQVTRK